MSFHPGGRVSCSAHIFRFAEVQFIPFFFLRTLSLVSCLAGVVSSSGKEPACQCRRLRFNPWVGINLLRRAWQPTPAFLPGEPHGQRSLAGPRGLCRMRLSTHARCLAFPSLHLVDRSISTCKRLPRCVSVATCMPTYKSSTVHFTTPVGTEP